MSTGAPVVILGGDYNALVAARAYARRGIEVFVLHDGRARTTIRHSRAIREWVRVPFGQDPIPQWRSWLSTGPVGAVLLPAGDAGIELLVEHGDELREAGYRPIEFDAAACRALLSKSRTHEIAESAGIAHPRAVRVASLAQARAAAEQYGYPCALKPVRSHEFVRKTEGRAGKGLVVDRPQDLEAAYDRASLGDPELMLTEFVPGPDSNLWGYVTYLDANGDALVHFTKHKLRQWPIRFGSGSSHVTAWDPEVADAGLSMLRAAGVRGIGAVEFKRDERDGRLVLIECNLRLLQAHPLVQRAGVDLPLLAYTRALGDTDHTPPADPAPPAGYRDGLVLWMPADDIRAFVAHRRRGELTTGAWLRSLVPAARGSLFRWDDPLPALGQLVVTLREAWSRRRR